jgi:hypothetical protein
MLELRVATRPRAAVERHGHHPVIPSVGGRRAEVIERRTHELGRVEYLEDVCRLLWPGGERAATRELIVLPRRSRPRMLVPSECRPAATALRHYGEPSSWTARWGSRGLALVARSGGSRVLFRDRLRVGAAASGGIESYLADRLGREVRIGLYLSAPRANRKPVLQVLSPAGELLGIAKIGAGDVAARLVEAEHRALQTVALHRPARVVAPTVVSFDRWQQLPVLLLGALPVNERRVALAPDRLRLAMADIAAIGPSGSQTLAGSGYVRALRETVSRAPRSDDRELLEHLLGALLERSGDRSLRFGSWHGDWTPWNMASTRSGLLLWDWERFAEGVPVGFDALHHRLQSAIAPGGDPPGQAALRLWDGAALALRRFVAGAEEARVTALLYMMELAARHLADGQAAAGARLGAVGAWLLPAIEQGVRG